MEESFESLKKLCANYWKVLYGYEKANRDSQMVDYNYYRALALARAVTAKNCLECATGLAYYYNFEKECMEVDDELI